MDIAPTAERPASRRVAIGAVDRLSSGVHEVHGLPVLIVSTVAALVMLGGALILGDDGGRGTFARNVAKELPQTMTHYLQ